MSTVSTRVIVRNDMGRFIADIEGAATKTVEQALEVGVQASRDAAPVGHKHDLRSTPITSSFYKTLESRTRGFYGNFSKHAIFQDQGTGPHTMIGKPTFRFYWENEGRMWIPGLMGDVDIINHPGNPAVHFMDTGYRAIRRQISAIMQRCYPG